jgi:hypothetical protein
MNKPTLVTALLVVIVILIARPQVNQYLAEQELKSTLEKKAQKIANAIKAKEYALVLNNNKCVLEQPKEVVEPYTEAELAAFKEELTGGVEPTYKSGYQLAMVRYKIGYTRGAAFWNGKECELPERVIKNKELYDKEIDNIIKEQTREILSNANKANSN